MEVCFGGIYTPARYSCARRGQNMLPEPEDQDNTYTLILCEVLKGSLPVFKEFGGVDGRAAVIVVTDVDRLLPRYVVTLGQNPTSGSLPTCGGSSLASRMVSSNVPGRVSSPRFGRSRGGTKVAGNPGAPPDTPELRVVRARTALRHMSPQQPGSGQGSSALRTALESLASQQPGSGSVLSAPPPALPSNRPALRASSGQPSSVSGSTAESHGPQPSLSQEQVFYIMHISDCPIGL